jgi:hypothetical protein
LFGGFTENRIRARKKIAFIEFKSLSRSHPVAKLVQRWRANSFNELASVAPFVTILPRLLIQMSLVGMRSSRYFVRMALSEIWPYSTWPAPSHVTHGAVFGYRLQLPEA